MPVHTEKRTSPYRADQMYDLVADIDRYPEFLPWVTATRKIRSDDLATLYEMAIGFRMMREKFTSKVVFERPNRITVDYIRGPMRHLKNSWDFKERAEGGCEIEFHIDFEFRSSLLQRLIGPLFYDAVVRMVGAFETRATDVYGAPKT